MAVGVGISREQHAASPLLDHFLPVQSPCWSLSYLPCSQNVNVYDPYHFLSPPFDVHNNYVVVCVVAKVSSFVHCKTTSLVHHHPDQLSFSNVVYWVDYSDSRSFRRQVLEKNYIRFPFHPSFGRSHGPYIWLSAVLMDHSTHWG